MADVQEKVESKHDPLPYEEILADINSEPWSSKLKLCKEPASWEERACSKIRATRQV